ncbi:Allene oxide synthase-lipoxygenase protein [Nymphon striatum]|nr:Allene oxide synthase-lipoxygenase protein [Nymphon striatum]
MLTMKFLSKLILESINIDQLRRKNLRDKMKAARVIKTSNLTAENIEFKSLNEIENFWNGTIPGFPQPEVVNYWKEDTWFAAQRIQGADPGNIALVKRLNKAFKLNESRVKALTGHSADNLIKAKRLFITDIEILTKFPQYIWAPMALFYLDDNDVLMPLAIQLQRSDSIEDVRKNVEGEERQAIFIRYDPKYTWLLAKIFYNCAEAAHHQMVTHLGNLNINIIICKLIITGLLYKQGPKFDVLLTLEILKLTGNTHLLLDQIATIMFRYVSPSHPVFKLMKPHFYEMFGINFAGMYILLSEGGVADLAEDQSNCTTFSTCIHYDCSIMVMFGCLKRSCILVKAQRFRWLEIPATHKPSICKNGIYLQKILVTNLIY